MVKSIKIAFLSILMIHGVMLNAQSTNKMPIEIAKAFQNGTRSIDGEPGPNYWQNSADYDINATVFTKESKLSGSESIRYFNNSPDTLKIIVIRLYPDIYKKGNARSWSIGSGDLTDGMILSDFIIGGKKVDLTNGKKVSRTATNMYLHLDNYLIPNDSLDISVSWEFMIPKKHPIRMGNFGNDRLFLAYWYPQIAVYDDIDGWDKIEYLGTVEFYNDFNNYNVKINTPPGFMVWATGKLINMDKLYTKKVNDNYKKAALSNDIIKIFTINDIKNGKVLKSSKSNEWHFIAKHVPDFTFAVSKYSNWDATSAITDNKTGRRVTIDAVYPDSVVTFDHAAKFAQQSIRLLSDSLPGYPFPYSHITSFCNGKKGGGMESPMMVNEGDPTNIASTAGLIFHEISHTYFPFFMGTNERKYAWMDEGWAAWLTNQIVEQDDPKYNYLARITATFENLSGKEKEVPLMYLSYQIADYNSYRIHAYNRPAMAYEFLRNVLGDSIFKQVLHEYMKRWNGKHPIPYDFFNTAQNVSGQDLMWYIQPWFFNRAYADLGIKKVTFDNKIVIENNGGLPLPVAVTCYYNDSTKTNYLLNIGVWRTGDNAIVIQADTNKIIQRVKLGSSIIPDVIKSNNEMK